jgi:solute carrier family 25 carnitine/acylcarnitine transporter 20/29
MASSGDDDVALPWWLDFAGGVAGGCAGIVVGHPLDTVKLRMQAGQFASPTAALTQTVRAEGVRGLYKGMLSPVLGNVPLQAILFGVYGKALRALEGGSVSDTPSLTSVVAAGQIAGLVQLVVMCPSEHCKILLQHQRESAGAGATMSASGRRLYTGSIDCARDVLRKDGVRGLYKGMASCLVRDVGVCSYGMYYGVYEVVRQRFLTPDPTDPSRAVHPLATLAAGSACGLVSWSWCYPFDVIKSRIQSVPYSTERVTPFMRTAAEIYRASGWRGFFVGYWVMAVRSIPANAVTFYGYEVTVSTYSDWRRAERRPEID